LAQDGVLAWLEWLRAAAARPGVALVGGQQVAESMLLKGEAVYLVGGPWSLANLRTGMGEQLRVAPLPAGPNGPGSPVLAVEGIMFNPHSTATMAGLAFARYLTDVESQALLLATGEHVSANVNIDMTSQPILSVFRSQAAVSTVVWQDALWGLALVDGDALFQRVVWQGADPVTALQQLDRRIRQVGSGQ